MSHCQYKTLTISRKQSFILVVNTKIPLLSKLYIFHYQTLYNLCMNKVVHLRTFNTLNFDCN